MKNLWFATLQYNFTTIVVLVSVVCSSIRSLGAEFLRDVVPNERGSCCRCRKREAASIPTRRWNFRGCRAATRLLQLKFSQQSQRRIFAMLRHCLTWQSGTRVENINLFIISLKNTPSHQTVITRYPKPAQPAIYWLFVIALDHASLFVTSASRTIF